MLYIRLITSTTHAAECNLTSIGREHRIAIITRHDSLVAYQRLHLADIAGRLRSHIININIRIGRYRILGTRHLLASIGQSGSGSVPGYLGHIEIGSQRSIPRLSLHDILSGGYLIVLGRHGRHKDVFVITLIPIVPVANHKIVIYAGTRLVHILIDSR